MLTVVCALAVLAALLALNFIPSKKLTEEEKLEAWWDSFT